MKEGKDIEPIDKLFRQSLERYSPAPPASAWKNIRSRIPIQKPTPGKWLTSPGGLSVLSALVLIAFTWIIYKSFVVDPETANQNQSDLPLLIDTIIPQQSNSYKEKPESDHLYTDANQASDDIHKPVSQKPESIDDSDLIKKISIKNSRTNAFTIPQPSPNEKINTVKNPVPVINSETEIPVKKDVLLVKSKQDASVKSADKNVLFIEPDFIDSFIERSVTPIVTSVPDTISKKDAVPEKNKIVSLDSNPAGGKPGADPGKIPKSKNLAVQAAIYGNIGQVYQKNRTANLFYGGTITGGLWNTKWKAGIETGLGLAKYNDYGQVENTWMSTDSIIKTDTVWHQQDSLFYYEIIDSTIYTTKAIYDTITYKYDYTYLQIPFFITKQIGTFNKFSFDVKAGPLVGFMISKKESMTHTNNSVPGELTSSINKNYTRLDISWQIHIAPQLRWDVSKNLSLGISPTAILFVNNLYDKKNRPSSKPYGFSIYCGATYRFK